MHITIFFATKLYVMNIVYKYHNISYGGEFPAIKFSTLLIQIWPVSGAGISGIIEQ